LIAKKTMFTMANDPTTYFLNVIGSKEILLVFNTTWDLTNNQENKRKV